MSSASQRIQAPKGTRDVYPNDALRRRFITESWRRSSIRFGFDEIDGPTFEHLDLYTVKSGEEIVSELFSFQRSGGDTTFALRPEFTPTLARMYASKAGTLPKPVKWFMAGPFFRAERPQRGRLREFLQWNIDVIGGDDEASKTRADAEVIACGIDLLSSMGLTPEHVKVHLNDRSIMAAHLETLGVAPESSGRALSLLDKRGKLDPSKLEDLARSQGFEQDAFLAYLCRPADDTSGPEPGPLEALRDTLRDSGVGDWCVIDFNIARGLAYYTGTVFEFVADGERAVCGGGRYDNLIELFGGPPTPAVGFGMGDVVFGLLLEKHGLIPDEAGLRESLSRPMPMRPDAFVFSPDDSLEPVVSRVIGDLRRRGLHARRSSKATKNVGKLLKDAGAQHARRAVIVESAATATIKDLDSGEQSTSAIESVADTIPCLGD